MQHWLKRITPDRHTLEKLWCLRPFRAVVLDRGCWTFNRHSVTRAFALGLFIAFIPPTPLPVHIVTCVIVGVLFRLNLPVLIATTFVSNPLTWLPQVAGSIWVGAKLLGMDLMPFLHELHHRHLWDAGQAALGAAAARSAGAGIDRSRRGLCAGPISLAGACAIPAAAQARPIRRPRRRARLGFRRRGPKRDPAARPGAHRGSR